MPNSPSSKQVDIFSDSQHKLQYAELCTALYERELARLASQPCHNVSLLQRKLGGLKHHVKRIADTMLQKNCPLPIDIHNGSWSGKQAGTCPAKKHDAEKCLQWYTRYASIGQAIPIHVQYLAGEHIELDSIDRIDPEHGKLHGNKFGWFIYQGQSLKSIDIDGPQAMLIKPTKGVLAAACCGHSWDHKGKSQPRTLTLRELLLSVSINWKTLR